jgi:hypothetical protein
MKGRGLLLALVLAAIAVYFIFFTKVGEDKGGLEVMVDKYAEAKVKLTATNLEALAREVLTFAAEGEGLPGALEDLRRVHPTAGSAADAWGRRIRYEKLSDTAFRLTSAGPDGVFGTGDDIVKDD